MSRVSRVEVFIAFSTDDNMRVGTMARLSDGRIVFEFDGKFIASGLDLSPHELPLVTGVQSPKNVRTFDGLFGVFADSIPDGWAIKLMQRGMRDRGIDFYSASALDRLAWIGHRGMGALVYHPETERIEIGDGEMDLSRLADGAEQILEGDAGDVIPQLLVAGGSASGARPKVTVNLDERGRVLGDRGKTTQGEPWIIKFRSAGDSQSDCVMEWVYAEMARKAGLEVPQTRLIEDKRGRRWFAVRRFDRVAGGGRIHMHSLAGLLGLNFRESSIDYETLLRVTSSLTKSRVEVEKAFRLSCFNVIFHNRDDHPKNFSFLMDRAGSWRLAPAYDLTFTGGPGGEHATTIAGEGRAPGAETLLRLAAKIGISPQRATEVIGEVKEAMSGLELLAKQVGIRSHAAIDHARRSLSAKNTTAKVPLTSERKATFQRCGYFRCIQPRDNGRRKYCELHGRMSDRGELRALQKSGNL